MIYSDIYDSKMSKDYLTDLYNEASNQIRNEIVEVSY